MTNTLKKLLATLVVLSTAVLTYADDFGDSWFVVNTKNLGLTEDISTKTQVEFRLPESERIGYFRLTQKFNYDLGHGWKAATNPTIENTRVLDRWIQTYRVEFELNPPKYKFGDNGPSLSMRNRWELRWKEGNGSTIFHRFRQFNKATWKIDLGPFNSYSVGNEIFFEEHKGKISMNRFYPISLSTKPTDKLKIDYFLLYQSKRLGTTSKWNGAYILGANISL